MFASTLSLSLALVQAAPPTDQVWHQFLARGTASSIETVVQEYDARCIHLRQPDIPGSRNLSRKIEFDEVRWHTSCSPYTIPSRTRNGQFEIFVPSEPVYGTMDSLDDNGHHAALYGNTDKDEPLVGKREPLATIGSWRWYNDDFMLLKYTYYKQVYRIVRCGNYFPTIGKVTFVALVPRLYLKTHTEDQFEGTIQRINDQSEAPCPTPCLPNVEYPIFHMGGQVQAQASTSSVTSIAEFSVWKVSGTKCRSIAKSPYCPPITGETPPPSQSGPPPGVTTGPNPFENPGSDIHTPTLPTNTGVRNANGH